MDHINIGTSGWMYDHWIGRFYPKGMENSKMLEHYAKKFSTVEINNAFYQLPTKESIKTWEEKTPKDFIFAVKGSRYLTHMKNLKDPKESSEKFFNAIEYFERNLGPILFQLSSNWHKNKERLEKFIHILPEKYEYVFELRHSTWFCEEIYEILRKNNIALCFHDFKGKITPLEITSDQLIYIRLHGSEGNYRKMYSGEQLNWWVDRIQEWENKVNHIYLYFNNDAFGNAVNNAIELREKLKEERNGR